MNLKLPAAFHFVIGALLVALQLAAVSVQAGPSGLAGGEIIDVEVRLISASAIDASEMSAKPRWLFRHRLQIDQVGRAKYFKRWHSFAKKAAQCRDPQQTKWLFDLASLAGVDADLRRQSALYLEQMILADPHCFLGALRDVQDLARQGNIIATYVFMPLCNDPMSLNEKLQGLIGDEGYLPLRNLYRGQLQAHLHYADRASREAQSFYSQSRKRHWTALQDPDFFERAPQEYLGRLAELENPAWQCADAEATGWYIEAVFRTGSVEALYERNRSKVEELARHHPECLFNGLKVVSHPGEFLQQWLIEAPGKVAAHEIYDTVAKSIADDDRLLRIYKRIYAKYLYEISDPVRPATEFLWSVKFVRTYANGLLLVPATYIKGYDEFQPQLEQLWQQTPDSGFTGSYDQPLKILPRDALQFMTLDRFGTYYIFDMKEDGVEVIKARVMNAVLQRWPCDGESAPVVAMLSLQPETPFSWPLVQGDWSAFYPAVELRDDLPLPAIINYDPNQDDRLFQAGRLSWGDAGSEHLPEYDFSHSQSYTDPIFGLVNAQTGEEHDLPRNGFPMCH